MQARTVRVVRQLSEPRGGGFAFGPPKSEAGQRTVAIPEVIMPDLALHVMTHAAPGDDGLVFTSPGGDPLRHSNFRRRVWVPALRPPGCDRSIFTTCAIPETRLRPVRARTCES